jgi:predicted nuclease with TOPRIM domain
MPTVGPLPRTYANVTMTVDETRRIELYEQLSVLVGAEAARTSFELLPPAGRDVATSDDIDHLARDLRAGMTQLRSDLRGEMAELRREMTELRGDLHGEMAERRGEMIGSRGELRGELQAMTERIEGSATRSSLPCTRRSAEPWWSRRGPRCSRW